MPGQHGTSLKDYTQALTTQPRLRKVPGKAIGQIVAEVESHVRETGEDPVEVFGQPGSYSAQYSGEASRAGASCGRRCALAPRPRWPWVVA
jgi:non-ribosomal peptide synthetase component F